MPAHSSESIADEASLKRLVTTALDSALQQQAPSSPSGRDMRILDLACGSCREVGTLTEAVSARLPSPAGRVRFVGADIRGPQLNEARDRARLLGPDAGSFEFFEQDCSKLDQIRELGRDFDLVFLRHQNYWHDRPAWRRIFANGMERLSDSGLLVITSYFDKEHELAVNAIRAAGGELVTSLRNERSRSLPSPGKSVDRHIAVFRRPGAVPGRSALALPLRRDLPVISVPGQGR